MTTGRELGTWLELIDVLPISRKSVNSSRGADAWLTAGEPSVTDLICVDFNDYDGSDEKAGDHNPDFNDAAVRG